jgi:LmbE family N-acetylglucosaminyl deacetylase
VARIYCFESSSTTVEFQPGRFVAVDEFMDRKLAVIRAYTTHVRTRRHLDAELLRATSRYWSRYGQSRFVEPFEVAREITSESDGADASESRIDLEAVLGAEAVVDA